MARPSNPAKIQSELVLFDDIVIGSGLSALGTVLGLGRRRRVLMLAGPKRGLQSFYGPDRGVPCAYLGVGGLGNFWHGVIPMSMHANFGAARDAEFAHLFARFYPRTPVRSRLHRQQLFVPWRPVRPTAALARLRPAGDGALSIQTQTVDRFCWRDSRISVQTFEGPCYETRRLWIAAGALHTPALLERSLGRRFSRGYVSDHVLCYVGLLSAAPPLQISRTRDGVFFPAYYDQAARSLYTLRPARFGFRTLDFGIEQRAAFGMPTGRAIAKIVRRLSPGLLAEALYNRTGWFAQADCYSVYAQTAVRDAYTLKDGSQPIAPRIERIRHAAADSRERVPFDGTRCSQRHDLYIPGIHLHHSIAPEALAASGVDQPGSPIQVVDASALPDLGPDHHSFKLMLLAETRARRASSSARALDSA
jgi:hypothetical protein